MWGMVGKKKEQRGLVRNVQWPSALDVGVHCIYHTHLSMEMRWKMLVMGDRGEGRIGKRSHAATEKEDSLRTGEESQRKEHLIPERQRYL